MGKNLIQQARGKGGPRYRAPSFKYKGKIGYISPLDKNINGKVIDLIHCRGHSSPLAHIKYEDEKENIIPAPEGIKVGDNIENGNNVEIKIGNTLPLKNIPEGTLIYNIEGNPGDGGKFVRAGGVFARVITKIEDGVTILLPSKKEKKFRPDCRATIGTIAGSGRTEKPFLKAGTMYYAMKARNRLWPKTSGTSMNAVDQRFGVSAATHKGRPTQAPRNAPPGRKVGKIAPTRTGRKKR